MLGQPDRQLLLRYRNDAIRGTVDDRDGGAPVALPADQPVAQAVDNHVPANAIFLQVLGNFVNSLFGGRAIEWAGIDHDAQVLSGFCPGRRVARPFILWADDLSYRY